MDFEKCLQNFIVVIKSVSTCNKRKLYQCENTDMVACYRSNLKDQGVGPGEKKRMETSTPISYRHKPVIELASSPLGQGVTH